MVTAEQGAIQGTFVASYCDSVTAVPEADWDRLLPGTGATWRYFRTVEQAPPPGFRLAALVARRGAEVVGVAPLFSTVYRFDTAFQGEGTVQAALRRMGDTVFRYAPRLVSMEVLSVGSPQCDDSHIGLAPELNSQERSAVFDAMLAELRDRAKKQRIPLIAAKGLVDDEVSALQSLFDRQRFAKVTTIPNVILDLPFHSLDGYLGSLSDGTARYLKRKWRSASKVTVEHRASLAGLEDEINTMFAATLEQSKVDYGDFSRVHPDYFASVLRDLGERARLMLCWVDGELLSFQLYLVGEHEVLAKGIGMKYPRAKDYNLYFLNWREMITYCLEHRIPRISMSGTTYSTKTLMGGRIDQRFVFFRFTSDLLNRLLPRLAPAFDYESNDPELKAIRAKQSEQPRPARRPKEAGA
jgi:hypothetical protein